MAGRVDAEVHAQALAHGLVPLSPADAQARYAALEARFATRAGMTWIWEHLAEGVVRRRGIDYTIGSPVAEALARLDDA